jgi:hypothetical protein
MATRIILYSAGLDSFAGYRLLDRRNPGEWKKVYFPIGSRYGQKEFNVLPGDVYITKMLDLRILEQADGYVPQRNALFVTGAQAYYDADEIALCGVKGEFSRDKHPKFYRQMSDLLSYTAGKPVRVFSPFERMTKTQAVRTLLEPGGKIRPEVAAGIAATTSCYHPTLLACGDCQSCFRRWVASENNGLTHLTKWDSDPWVAHIAPVSNLRRLPISQIGDFTRAQWDVVTAYWKLNRRTGYMPL